MILFMYGEQIRSVLQRIHILLPEIKPLNVMEYAYQLDFPQWIPPPIKRKNHPDPTATFENCTDGPKTKKRKN